MATALTEIGRHGTISPALATLGLGLVPLLDLASDSRTATWRRREGGGADRRAERTRRAAAGPAGDDFNGRLNGTKVGVPYASKRIG